MLEAGVGGRTQLLTEVDAEPPSLELSVSSAVWSLGMARKGPAVVTPEAPLLVRGQNENVLGCAHGFVTVPGDGGRGMV